MPKKKKNRKKLRINKVDGDEYLDIENFKEFLYHVTTFTDRTDGPPVHPKIRELLETYNKKITEANLIADDIFEQICNLENQKNK